MATITGLTAERMIAIEGASVVSGQIDENDHLILTKFDGTTVDAGALPPGPQGPEGPAGGLIPGEVRLWSGDTLPLEANYGKWVWADGSVYAISLYPIAAAHIATQWRTFAGASDPGVLNFRVPDLRGLVPAGMDQMPGGSRANRVTRAVSIVIAGKTGEEIHTITVAEMPAHTHTYLRARNVSDAQGGAGGVVPLQANDTINTGSQGGGTAHENMQPTVFVPYIVKLDD